MGNTISTRRQNREARVTSLNGERFRELVRGWTIFWKFSKKKPTDGQTEYPKPMAILLEVRDWTEEVRGWA